MRRLDLPSSARFAEKLAEFGCQVEWQPVKEGEGMLWLSGLNTESLSAEVRWFSHPPQHLQPELEVRLPRGAKLEAEIVVTFLETPLAVSCDRKDIHFVRRAEIKRKIKILGRDWPLPEEYAI